MIRMQDVRRVDWAATPDNIRRELERLGLAQTEAAALLRIDPRTMRRYLQEPGSPGAAHMPFGSFALLRLTKKDNAR